MICASIGRGAIKDTFATLCAIGAFWEAEFMYSAVAARLTALKRVLLKIDVEPVSIWFGSEAGFYYSPCRSSMLVKTFPPHNLT